eukprot:5578968-Pyramimonas_sp.AAC.1
MERLPKDNRAAVGRVTSQPSSDICFGVVSTERRIRVCTLRSALRVGVMPQALAKTATIVKDIVREINEIDTGESTTGSGACHGRHQLTEESKGFGLMWRIAVSHPKSIAS